MKQKMWIRKKFYIIYKEGNKTELYSSSSDLEKLEKTLSRFSRSQELEKESYFPSF